MAFTKKEYRLKIQIKTREDLANFNMICDYNKILHQSNLLKQK